MMDNEKNAAYYRVKNFHAFSSYGFDHATFEWTIENFSLCPLTFGEYIDSPIFTCAGSGWNLRLYPKGYNFTSYTKEEEYIREEGYVIVHLVRGQSQKERMKDKRATYKINLLDLYGETAYSVEEENVRILYGETAGGRLISQSILFNEKKSELLSDDTLTIYCEVTAALRIVHGSVRNATDMLKQKSTAAPLNALSQDLKHLSSNSKWCDMTLKAGGQEFPVIKAILASRSPVFEAMFQPDTKESISGVVDIPDIEGPIMQHMLQYAYTNEVEILSMDVTIKLFVAADKYGLADLKEKCSRFLVESLSADNLCDIAVLADMHNDKTLKGSVRHFAVQNPSNVFATDKWKAMLRERPFLASEIMEAVTTNFMTNTS